MSVSQQVLYVTRAVIGGGPYLNADQLRILRYSYLLPPIIAIDELVECCLDDGSGYRSACDPRCCGRGRVE